MKKALIVIGSIIATLLVLAFVLPFAFKGRIVDAVKQEANKNITAKVDFGGFGLSIFRSFPDFTLSMEDVTIIGSGDFQADTLANIPSLLVTVDLMSVIRGTQYEVKKVVLTDPRFLLHVLSDGRANWDIVKPTAPGDTAAATKVFRLQLQQFTISQGMLAYHDEESGFSSTVLDVDMNLSGKLVDDLGTFKIALNSPSVTADYGGIRYLSGAVADLTTNLDTDLKAYKFTFADALVKLNELSVTTSGFFAMPEEGYDMDIKFAARENTFKNFLSLLPAIYSKDFAKVETKGTLAFDGFVKGLYSDKQIPAFTVHLAVDDAMFKYPGLPGAVTDIAINADISNPDGMPDHTAIDAPLIRLKIINNTINAKLSLRTPVSDPQFDFTVNGILDLADLPKVYPMAKGYDMSGMMKVDLAMAGKLSDIKKQQYTNVKAAGNMEATRVSLRYPGIPNAISISKAMMVFSPAFIEMTTFSMQTGKSDLSASGKLQNYLPFFLQKDEVLAGNFVVKSSYLDINQLMPAEPDAAKASDSAMGKGIEIPGNINMQLKGAFGKLIYDKYKMDNVSGIVSIKDKKITFTDVTMNMIGGAIAISGIYNAAEPAKPLLDMVFDIKNVDVQQALTTFNTVEALAPIAAKTKGLISAHLQMKTSLDGNLSPVLSSLAGNGNLLSALLTIANVNTMDKIADALKMDKLRKWSLEKVNLSYEFVDGKVFVKPFPVSFGNIKANLGGSTGFDKSINYTINLEIPRSEFGGQANNVLNNLVTAANKKGAKFTLSDLVPVTLLVGGTITDPKISVNLKNSMNSAVDDLKNQALDELNKKKAEAEAKARGEASKFINEADASAEKLIAEAARKGQQLIDAAKVTADKLKAEAATRADQIRAEGKKNGPIATLAANKAADQVNKEAASQATNIIAEAQKQSQALQDKARAQAAEMKQQARDKAGIK